MMGYLWWAPKRKQQQQGAERESLLEDGGVVPRGYLAVYVGAEARRYVVPMSYLCRPAFRDLMERAAEEFGFRQAGGLRIPCCEDHFRETVAAIQVDDDQRRSSRRRRSNTMAAIKA